MPEETGMASECFVPSHLGQLGRLTVRPIAGMPIAWIARPITVMMVSQAFGALVLPVTVARLMYVETVASRCASMRSALSPPRCSC